MKNNEIKIKTIYFYAVNAGAIAVMSPIVDDHPSGINCIWVVNDYDKQEFNAYNNKITLNEFLNNIKKKQNTFEILILGSQHDFNKTVSTLKACKTSGVKTFFIFDHWGPYESHFTFLDNSLIFPDHILAIDEFVEKKLIEIGVDKDRISIIGHPGIENKTKLIKCMDISRKNEIKSNLGLKFKKKVLLLALELMAIDFDEDLEYGLVLTVLQSLKIFKDKDLQLVVKLHPHQSKDKFEKFVRKYKIADELIICPDTLKDYELISIADTVIGMNSTFLLIPLIIGVNTISIGFDLKNIDRKVTIPYLKQFRVKNATELNLAISKKMHTEFPSRIFQQNSVDLAWKEIK
ncbi:MAG: hypothetical protein GY760_09095 [Deltaproteobacteria bacterium]|nr:hypothetical protein [Deltaproteobacteria bacterium]